MIHGRDIILDGCLSSKGDGREIHLWNNPWICDLPRRKLSSTPPEECQLKWVHELIDLKTKSGDLSPSENLINPIKK